MPHPAFCSPRVILGPKLAKELSASASVRACRWAPSSVDSTETDFHDIRPRLKPEDNWMGDHWLQPQRTQATTLCMGSSRGVPRLFLYAVGHQKHDRGGQGLPTVIGPPNDGWVFGEDCSSASDKETKSESLNSVQNKENYDFPSSRGFALAPCGLNGCAVTRAMQ